MYKITKVKDETPLNEIIRKLKTTSIPDRGVFEAGDAKKGWFAQIQNHGKNEVSINYYREPNVPKVSEKLSSAAWGRIWYNGKIKEQFKGPINVVRNNMIKYLSLQHDSVKDASPREVRIYAEKYLKELGKNNSIGKYDKVIMGVMNTLGQGFLHGNELDQRVRKEVDRLLEKYNLNDSINDGDDEKRRKDIEKYARAYLLELGKTGSQYDPIIKMTQSAYGSGFLTGEELNQKVRENVEFLIKKHYPRFGKFNDAVPEIDHVSDYLWRWTQSYDVASEIFNASWDNEKNKTIDDVEKEALRNLDSYTKNLKSELDKKFLKGKSVQEKAIKDLCRKYSSIKREKI